MNIDDLERAKKIRVFKNGDEYSTGTTVIVNRRQIANIRVLRDILTQQLHASEAVRKLCTPSSGTEIKRLDKLIDNGSYIAVGNSKFKKNVKYQFIGEEKKRNKKTFEEEQAEKNEQLGLIQPLKTARNQPQLPPFYSKSILVYANGKEYEKAKRVVLTKHVLECWPTAVMNELTKTINVISGAVQGLYKLSGEEVQDVDELEAGGTYVAVGTEIGGFKQIQYGLTKPVFNIAGRVHHRFLSPLPYPDPRRNSLDDDDDEIDE